MNHTTKERRERQYRTSPEKFAYHLDAEALRRIEHRNRRDRIQCANYQTILNGAARVTSNALRKDEWRARREHDDYSSLIEFCRRERLKRDRAKAQLWKTYEILKLKETMQKLEATTRRLTASDIDKMDAAADIEVLVSVLRSDAFRIHHGTKLAPPEPVKAPTKMPATTNLARQISCLEIKAAKNKISSIEGSELVHKVEDDTGHRLARPRRRIRSPLTPETVPFIAQLKMNNIGRKHFVVRDDSDIIQLPKTRRGETYVKCEERPNDQTDIREKRKAPVICITAPDEETSGAKKKVTIKETPETIGEKLGKSLSPATLSPVRKK